MLKELLSLTTCTGLSSRVLSVTEAQRLVTNSDITKLIEVSQDAIDDDEDHTTSTISEDGTDAECDLTQLDPKDILEDLDTYTQCLVDLSPSLAFPATDRANPEEALVGMIVRSREPHQYHANLIGARFPEAAPEIVEHLGRCNLERYKRVSAERIANLQTPQLPGKVLDEGTASHFQDSGLGSSLPAQMDYAPSMTSYFSSSAGGDRPHLPALPEEAKRGTPFTCDACGEMIRVTNKRDWK